MPAIEHSHHEQTLADYVAIVRRHIWVIVVVAVAVPVTAFVVASRQPKVFSASSKVLLSQQDLGSALTGVPSATSNEDPVRVAQTQSEIARTREVAQQAIQRAGVTGMFAQDLLDNSSVSPETNSDILDFTVDNGSPTVATKLANAYADAYAANKYRIDTITLVGALKVLDNQLAQLRRTGQTSSQMYQSLLGQDQNLRTIETLQTRPTVVKLARVAGQIQPNPKRDAVFGAVLGIMLGVGVAFLWNALDKRVRTEQEVESILSIPLLARVPKLSRRLRGSDRLPMLSDPAGAFAEAVRRLKTNLELANVDLDGKVIMVTSAAPLEGKSSTIANLAVALARSGRSVVLVDLDLRRPSLAAFFDLEERPGLTDVTLGRVTLQEALVPVPLTASKSLRGRTAQGWTVAEPELLHVLPSGRLPANPGEFVGTQSVANLLQHLRHGHDFVLVDAPPLLLIDDAMVTSTRVDGIFAVVDMEIASRPMLRDLGRGLHASPARKLGFVVTNVDERKLYGTSTYGYYTRVDVPETPAQLRQVTSSGR
jgi:capsular exopolysaccharide synthesis family protein